MKIVSFSRVYEVEDLGKSNEEIIQDARAEFIDEFEFLDGSSDNFSARIIKPEEI